MIVLFMFYGVQVQYACQSLQTTYDVDAEHLSDIINNDIQNYLFHEVAPSEKPNFIYVMLLFVHIYNFSVIANIVIIGLRDGM